MNIDSIKPGQVLPLVRVLNRCPDPIDLFVRLTDGGLRPDTLLLESGDTTTRQGERSLLITGCALRAQCRGRQVEVTALNANGIALLPWLADRLGLQAEVVRKDAALHITYPPIPRGSEDERLLAPSPVDVLRAMACGASLTSGEASLGPLVAGGFSYDLLGVYESLSPSGHDPLEWPDYEFWLPDRTIWVQHKQRNTVVLAHVFGGEQATSVYHDATTAIAKLASAVEASAEARPRPSQTTAPRDGTSGGRHRR